MAKLEIPFVGQSYAMPAAQLDSQTCINWYLVYDHTGKNPIALVPDPGLVVWGEIAAGKSVRGEFELNDVFYAVIDNKFYSFDGNATPTELGTLKTSVGNVEIIPNSNQLFLTDTVHGYVYQIKKSDEHDAGEFFIVDEAESVVSQPTFDGAGLDDMTTSTDGGFTGFEDTDYAVEIDTASGVVDKFRWSDSKGASWNETEIPITDTAQTLNNNVQIRFQHKQGHTLNDRWDFTATIDSSFYVPVIPAFIDTYGIYIKINSDQYYISAQNDFSKVNALDTAKENAWPDNLVAAVSIREELWLIGRTTSRIWYNTGASVFPFEPRTNLLVRSGTIAPYSVAIAENNILMWLSRNDEGGRIVIMMDGYNAVTISTEPVSAAISDYSVVEDAKGFVYQWDGHVFYNLTFPTENRTWVYDLTTKDWHEKRSTFDAVQPSANQVVYGRWRANNYAYFKGMHLVGDFESGKIFKISRNVYTEDGKYILRERVTRILAKSLHRLCIHSLQLDMEKGVGLTDDSVQGHDPQVMLQISTDDGQTWGNEMWRSIGKTGRRRERIVWNRLGQSDSFTFRIRITDPVYTMLMGAVAEIEDVQT